MRRSLRPRRRRRRRRRRTEEEEEEEEEEERVERFEEWVSFCGSSSRIEGRKLGESMEARRWNTAVS